MSFPSQNLKPCGGAISGFLFENPRTGLARDVYWRVCVEFEAFMYQGEYVESSAEVEWIRWGHRSWRDLANSCLEDHHRDLAEASFYVKQHDWAKVRRLEIAPGDGASFPVHLDMLVDFAGVACGDAQVDMRVAASIQLPFEGIYICPETRDLKRCAESEILELARPFLKVEDFSLQLRGSGGLFLAPRMIEWA